MFESWSEDLSIEFILHSYHLRHMQAETKEFLRKNAACVDCGSKISAEFFPCKCKGNHEVNDEIGHYRVLKRHSDEFYEHIQRESRREISRRSSSIRKMRMRRVIGFHTKEDIKEIFHAQNEECIFCAKKIRYVKGKKTFQVDHTVPIVDEGTDWPSNLMLVCGTCNKQKHSKSAASFWSVIKKKRGGDFVNERRLLSKSCGHIKRKLTTTRKKQLKDTLGEIRDELIIKVLEKCKSKGMIFPR